MFKMILFCFLLATNSFAATSNILNVGNAGMNGTDWADCSSQITPSAGFGTVTNKQIYCRRVGDSLQVRGNFQWGTAAASTVYLEVSSLYTINTSKLPTTTNGTFLGKGHQSDGTGAQIESSGIGHAYFYDGSTNNQIFLTRASSSGTATYLKQNGTSFAGGNFESFFIEFPVSGWTSGGSSNTGKGPRIAYTPTFTNFGTSPTNNSIRYRYEGSDTIRIKGVFTTGTSMPASVASMSLPSGLTVKSSLVTSRELAGFVIHDIASQNYSGLITGGETSVKFGYGTTGLYTPANGNDFLASQEVSVDLLIPVQ